MRLNVYNKIALPIGFIAVFLLIWQSLTSLLSIDPSLLPSPTDAFKGGLEVFRSGLLMQYTLSSLFRVFTGFLLAAILAIPLGLLVGNNAIARYTVNPFVQIVKTISPIAWIPLAIFWFGIGNAPGIFIIFITAFFPIFLSTSMAVKNVDQTIVKVARNLGANGSTLLFRVIFPSILPYIVIALRVSLGISWVIVVAAEMVGMNSGLGYMILDARNFLRTDIIIAGMAVIGIIGYILDAILAYVEKEIRSAWGI